MLTVEDGTGLPDADSYVSVAACDAYHAAMGNDGWDATVSAKEVALRRATQYVDSRYRFRGAPLNVNQALDFPRIGYSWPIRRLTDAVCELALRGIGTALISDAPDERVTEETIGPLTTKFAAPVNGGQTRFTVVDDLLHTLLADYASRPGVTKLVRA
jgi:hypothetical protein